MGNRIPQSFIQDVLARTDIVELIQARVSLQKRGNNYIACCPFHEEKTPSFTVSADKQFYYCFGCKVHGNAIGFLLAYDKFEFIDAITYLADQLGMEIPQTHATTVSDATKASYLVMEKVALYYQQALRQSTAAINYLKSRGLTGHTAKHFAIGYAPPKWENLLPHFHQDEKIQSQLIANGLLIKKTNRCYDRFRHRILFPIRDVRGRTVAFGGRSLGNEQPKYLNSPETVIFHKSHELYGLYEARQQNHKLKRIIIVEGYMDVVSLHQHGITYAVATLGTATNPRHLQKLFRYTSEVIFCFDGDNAGREAAWSALTTNLPQMRDGIHVRFLFLPEGEDPDSWVQKIGKHAFEEQLERSESLSVVFFNHLKKEISLDSLDQKATFAKQACNYLNTMPQGLFRELLFKELISLLNIDAADLAQFQLSEKPTTQTTKPPINSQRILPPAYLAIAILLQQPELASHISNTQDLETILAPGVSLLSRLISLFQQNPALNTGNLLALCENTRDQQKIAQLAARRLPIPTEGLALELKGALRRLYEQHADNLAQQLIQKAKTTNLTPEEKKKLHKLLTKPAIDPI